MPAPARTLVLLALCVGAFAGCGGSDKVDQANSYVDSVNRAQNRFASTIDSLTRQITTTSTPAQDKATLARFQAAVDRVVGDLRAVDPPSEVRDLHGNLITAMQDFGKQVQEVSEALSSGNTTRLLAAQEQLAKATATVSQKINTTIAAINRKLGA